MVSWLWTVPPWEQPEAAHKAWITLRPFAYAPVLRVIHTAHSLDGDDEVGLFSMIKWACFRLSRFRAKWAKWASFR
jgi:hypothetical protein